MHYQLHDSQHRPRMIQTGPQSTDPVTEHTKKKNHIKENEIKISKDRRIYRDAIVRDSKRLAVSALAIRWWIARARHVAAMAANSLVSSWEVQTLIE